MAVRVAVGGVPVGGTVSRIEAVDPASTAAAGAAGTIVTREASAAAGRAMINGGFAQVVLGTTAVSPLEAARLRHVEVQPVIRIRLATAYKEKRIHQNHFTII